MNNNCPVTANFETKIKKNEILIYIQDILERSKYHLTLATVICYWNLLLFHYFAILQLCFSESK